MLIPTLISKTKDLIQGIGEGYARSISTEPSKLSMIKKVTDGILIGALQGANGIIGGAIIGAVHGYAQHISDLKHYEAGKDSITSQDILVDGE